MKRSASSGRVETTLEGQASSPKRLPGVSSAHFLKLVEERGKIGFWTSEFATNQVTISIGLYRILGIDPSIPQTYADMMKMMHPDDRPMHEDMRATVHSGQAIDRQFRIIRPDRTIRWIQNKVEVIVDTDGRPVRAIGLMADITDQHEARRTVAFGAERYKTLVDTIALVEWRANGDGTTDYVPAWGELTGQTSEQASGLGWLDAIHPDDRDATLKTWQEAVSQRSSYASDHRIRCADGIYRHILARAAPVLEADGCVREWVGVLIGALDLETHQSSGADAKLKPIERLQPSQIRAARALLQWSLDDLTEAAKVSKSSIRRLEGVNGEHVRPSIVSAVRAALEAAGVTFHSDEQDSVGVFLRARPASCG